MRQTASLDNLGLSRINVIETIFITPKRRFSRRSRNSTPPSETSSRRFTISFNPFLSHSSHHAERDQEKIDAKKRRTMEPEASDSLYSDLQMTQVISVMQKTKQAVFHKFFSTTPSEARRQKRAIAQWKNLTKELMFCDIMNTESSDTLTEETYRLPAKSSLIRQFILNELISTEESYLSHLHRVTTALLTLPCAIQPIFGDFPRLVLLSRSLIQGFKNTSSVADVFRQHEDDFEIYILYACNFEKNRKRITRTEVQCPSFSDMIQQLASTSDRLGLADYMIIPIQRIARYCLLLKELKKYTHPLDTEYSKIEVMLKSLTGLALAMNDVQKKLRR